jgi:hypothetical protein
LMTDLGVTGGGNGRHMIYRGGKTDHTIDGAVMVDHIVELVEEGVLSVVQMDASEWRFSGAALRRARIALRLERDLGLNLPGVALAIRADMLTPDQCESLRTGALDLGVLRPPAGPPIRRSVASAK